MLTLVCCTLVRCAWHGMACVKQCCDGVWCIVRFSMVLHIPAGSCFWAEEKPLRANERLSIEHARRSRDGKSLI